MGRPATTVADGGFGKRQRSARTRTRDPVTTITGETRQRHDHGDRSGPFVVDGGTGDDRIVTGSGNDRVTGGGGRDTIRTGAGDDQIDVADGRRDVVFCGPGNDTVKADRFDVLHGCEHRQRPTAARR